MKDLSFRGFPNLALAEGAITPNPGVLGAWAWSTTLVRPMFWNGVNWTTGENGVARTILPDDGALSYGAGWIKDNAAPASTRRVYNVQNNATVSFQCVNTTQLMFTLQRESGWGSGEISIDGVVVATITSNDNVGGGFLIDVPVLVDIRNNPKTVTIKGLLSASPFVFTKIAYTETPSVGGDQIVVSSTAPASPSLNQLWLDIT